METAALEDNKRLVRDWIEARNRNDTERAVACWAEGRRESLRKAFDGFTHAFPDIHVEIEELIAEGDKVVLRFRLEGTHRGPFRGVEATGKRVSWTSIDIYTIADGKIADLVREWKIGSYLRELAEG
jgi:steroid delta-isomerase-like uncharacterized protein